LNLRQKLTHLSDEWLKSYRKGAIEGGYYRASYSENTSLVGRLDHTEMEIKAYL